MPFKSEKQRRFMWSEHPDIAKRWAHEYPKQGKLPMYAHKTKGENLNTETAENQPEKEAAIATLRGVLGRFVQARGMAKCSESILKQVEVPHSSKPVAAGDEHVTAKKDALTGVTPPKKPGANSAILAAFNLNSGATDTDSTSPAHKQAQAQEIKQVLAKFAAQIRLGPSILKMVQAFNPAYQQAQSFLQGINLQNIQQTAQKAKADAAYIAHRNMVFGPPEQPKPAKQPAPVATYAGTKPKQPNVTSNNLASGGNPALTTIDRNGPLTMRGGQPVPGAVTGNSGGLAGGVLPGQKVMANG